MYALKVQDRSFLRQRSSCCQLDRLRHNQYTGPTRRRRNTSKVKLRTLDPNHPSLPSNSDCIPGAGRYRGQAAGHSLFSVLAVPSGCRISFTDEIRSISLQNPAAHYRLSTAKSRAVGPSLTHPFQRQSQSIDDIEQINERNCRILSETLRPQDEDQGK